MLGNVNEWVADVYRPLSPLDTEDFSPFRGNEFTKKSRDESGQIMVDSTGQIIYEVETRADNENRRNYRDGDVRNYKDGDGLSNADYGYGITTLINDKSRVYKGGSWNDRAYFMSPGSRRFLQEDQASSEIGFRCAMDMIGGTQGNTIRGAASRKQMRQVKKNRKARLKSQGSKEDKKLNKGKSGKKSKRKSKKGEDTGSDDTTIFN